MLSAGCSVLGDRWFSVHLLVCCSQVLEESRNSISQKVRDIWAIDDWELVLPTLLIGQGARDAKLWHESVKSIRGIANEVEVHRWVQKG